MRMIPNKTDAKRRDIAPSNVNDPDGADISQGNGRSHPRSVAQLMSEIDNDLGEREQDRNSERNDRWTRPLDPSLRSPTSARRCL